MQVSILLLSVLVISVHALFDIGDALNKAQKLGSMAIELSPQKQLLNGLTSTLKPLSQAGFPPLMNNPPSNAPYPPMPPGSPGAPIAYPSPSNMTQPPNSFNPSQQHPIPSSLSYSSSSIGLPNPSYSPYPSFNSSNSYFNQSNSQQHQPSPSYPQQYQPNPQQHQPNSQQHQPNPSYPQQHQPNPSYPQQHQTSPSYPQQHQTSPSYPQQYQPNPQQHQPNPQQQSSSSCSVTILPQQPHVIHITLTLPPSSFSHHNASNMPFY